MAIVDSLPNEFIHCVYCLHESLDFNNGRHLWLGHIIDGSHKAIGDMPDH
jgi:hypothetical protein